jgi:UDP-2-acetamido-2-deoxy-ribo-hexuluronate aminotransferase
MLAESCPQVVAPSIKPYNTSVYAQSSILVQDRDAVAKQLNKQRISTAVHYPVPLNQQPAYRSVCRGELAPVSDRTAGTVMSLPMEPDLSASDQERIVTALAQAIALGQNCNGVKCV